mmetsp:Transcript_233/g.525  ORF Transcript_233/g.525 Transcript_233/m.525 type:complete len:229 (+) Transcript_233:993-1679(+)
MRSPFRPEVRPQANQECQNFWEQRALLLQRREWSPAQQARLSVLPDPGKNEHYRASPRRSQRRPKGRQHRSGNAARRRASTKLQRSRARPTTTSRRSTRRSSTTGAFSCRTSPRTSDLRPLSATWPRTWWTCSSAPGRPERSEDCISLRRCGRRRGRPSARTPSEVPHQGQLRLSQDGALPPKRCLGLALTCSHLRTSPQDLQNDHQVMGPPRFLLSVLHHRPRLRLL